MVQIQAILQDIAHLLQDVDKLLQDVSGQKLGNMLDNCGSPAGNGSGGSNPSQGCNNQGVSGSGSITGDPHFVGAEGQKYSVQGEAGNTYNLLSDTGLEVNGKFQAWGNSGANTVGEMGIDLNGDHVDIKPGQLTINGQQIDMSKPGSYLNGAVTVNQDGSVTVKNDHYTLNITNGGGYLNTNITATNAGRHEQPGGLWGQSLDGQNVDTNAADFQVSSLFGRQDFGGGGQGMDSIPVDFTPPTLQGNTITDALNYEKAIMIFSTQVNASTTAINTLGNVEKDSVSKMAQS